VADRRGHPGQVRERERAALEPPRHGVGGRRELVRPDRLEQLGRGGQGRQVRVRTIEVQFRKWNQGIVGGVNQISARVDSMGPYERGLTPGIEATWTEALALQKAMPAGWSFNGKVSCSGSAAARMWCCGVLRRAG